MSVTRATGSSPLAPRATSDASFQNNGVQLDTTSGKNLDIRSASADAFIQGGTRNPMFEAYAQTRLPGGIEAQAYATGPRLDFRADADAKLSRSGIDVSVDVDINATLLEAGAGGKVSIPVEINGEKLTVEIDLKAEGVVGAKGKLNLDIHIGTNGKVEIRAGAEGFIGAKAGLTGGIAVKHEGRNVVSGSLELSASAGASAKGTLDIDLSKNGVEFHVGGEATAGAGFGFDTRGKVDSGNTARLLVEVLAGAVENGLSFHSESLEEIRDWAGDRFGDVKNRIDQVLPDRIDWTPWN